MKRFVPGTDIPYQVVRTKRKTCCFKFLPDGTLEARVPYRLGVLELERLFLRHMAWIQKHKGQAFLAAASAFRCEDGAEIPFLGRRVPIFLSDELSRGYRIEEKGLVLCKKEAMVQLKAFYRDAARSYLPPLVSDWERKTGLYSDRLRIGSAEKSWGRCSAKREITLSLRLMMLPKDCIDYVVVHELCHLKELNHSKAFWQQVDEILPERKALEARMLESYVISFKEIS